MSKEVSKAVVAGVGEFVSGADSAENQSEVTTHSDTQDELDPSRVEPCNAEAQSLCNCRAFASVSLLMLEPEDGEVLACLSQGWRDHGPDTSGDLSTQVKLATMKYLTTVDHFWRPF